MMKTPERLLAQQGHSWPPATELVNFPRELTTEFGATSAYPHLLAALTSQEANQDPIDLAFLAAARERHIFDAVPAVTAVSFQPFDPQSRRAEAVVEQNGQRHRVMKGAVRAAGFARHPVSIIEVLIKADLTAILVVQDHVEQATVDRQSGVTVIDESQAPELIHEMTDTRPGCADHLRQGILVYGWKYPLGFTFLAEMSKQQKNPGQTLLARVEKLVDEIRFISDVPRKQMLDEQFRDIVLFVKYARH